MAPRRAGMAHFTGRALTIPARPAFFRLPRARVASSRAGAVPRWAGNGGVGRGVGGRGRGGAGGCPPVPHSPAPALRGLPLGGPVWVREAAPPLRLIHLRLGWGLQVVARDTKE